MAAPFRVVATGTAFVWRQSDPPLPPTGPHTAAPRRQWRLVTHGQTRVWRGAEPAASAPFLSAAAVTEVTQTSARPRVTITVP